MFREIIGSVKLAFSPHDVKLFLPDAVAYPVESHVNGFRPFLLHCVMGDSCGCGVVGDDWRRWLRVTEFFKANADGACFFGVVEDGG